MRIQTDKERSEKNTKIVVLIFLIFALVYFCLYMMHFYTLMNIDKRLTSSEAMELANTHMLENFTEIEVSSGEMTMILMIASVLAMGGIYLYSNKQLRKADTPEEALGEARLMNLKDLKEFNIKRNSPYGEKTNDGFDNMILSKDIM